MCLAKCAVNTILVKGPVDSDEISVNCGSVGGWIKSAEFGCAQPTASSEMPDKRRRRQMPDLIGRREIRIADIPPEREIARMIDQLRKSLVR
ncbi:hypothetical protein CUJ87_21485 [Paraburkholderia caledonica]|nr:hypothetical protein CUJ87_21485 [Paraburkholderia caledonica]